MPDSALQPGFVKKQYEFTAHIRDPENQPLPSDVPDVRMGIYRELFFNNVAGFLNDMFPVIRSLYDDERWNELARDFFAHHKCHTPYFLEISQEFIEFLQNERDNPNDPPFLLELAHYEWVELALDISEEVIDYNGIDHDGDLLEGRPVLSPLAWNLAYNYDVQHIGAEYQPAEPPAQPTNLVVYRDIDDDVRFMEINPVTARLIQIIEVNDNLTGREVMSQIATELQHPDPETVIQGGLGLLQELKQRDIILGTRL